MRKYNVFRGFLFSIAYYLKKLGIKIEAKYKKGALFYKIINC